MNLERPDGTAIHYEVCGSGPPLLLLAPRVVNSQIDSWERTPFDPRLAFADSFSVIAMDQRHVGRSTGPIAPFDYGTAAEDQLAVIDAVGAERVLVLGWGIGGNYALRLVQDTPARVAGAVLVEPMGRDATNSRHDFYELFEETLRLARAEGLRAVVTAAKRLPYFDENPAAGPYAARLHGDPAFAKDALERGRERYAVRVVRFRDGLWPDDTPYFSVPEAFVRSCPVPLLVAPGSNGLHPGGLAHRIATEAPQGELFDATGDRALVDAIGDFLHQNRTRKSF